MAKKPVSTKNKQKKTDSNPKVKKKQEIKMFACNDVFNSNKITLCDKGSGKTITDLSQVTTKKSPNLKTCMEKAGQLKYRKCSESEVKANTIKTPEPEAKIEVKPQDTKPEVKANTIKTPEPEAKLEAKPQDTKPEVKANTIKTPEPEAKPEIKPSTTVTKANVEICFAKIGTSTICSKITKEAVKVQGLSAITFDFANNDSDLVNKCQTAILGMSADFALCSSLGTSGDL